jgi:hypothetical protein
MTTLLGRSGRSEEFDVSLPDSLTPRFSLYMGTGLYGARNVWDPRHPSTLRYALRTMAKG